MTHSDRDGSDGYRDARREFVDRVIERAHTGGNGEDCPICQHENLPYPFLCRGTTAPAGLPLHESADRDADNVPSDRVRAYAEALRNPGTFVDRLTVTDAYPDGRDSRELLVDWQARAVMAVADRRGRKAEDTIARVEAEAAAMDEMADLTADENLASAIRLAARSIRAALRGPEPTEATSNEDAPGLDVGADAPTPVGAEPTDAP